MLFIAKKIHYLRECDSTNEVAKRYVKNKEKMICGDVFFTSFQKNGKGQRDKKWIAQADKSLTFSILLNTNFIKLKKQFFLNIVVSLAIVNALEKIIVDEEKKIEIKWPNDLFYGDKKLGGILIENLVQGDQLNYSIIGIGLNINELETIHSATSLLQITQKNHCIYSLLRKIIHELNTYFLTLKEHKYTELYNMYMENMYRYEKYSKFYCFLRKIYFSGSIVGVNELGQLKILSEEKEYLFSTSQIKFL